MDIIIENDGLNGISNYEPLKAWALEETAKYNGLVVQENAISFAKDDAASLRKTAKQASDLRIAIKKQHDAKIEVVTNQLKEITEIYEKAADAIAEQVKVFEQRAKEEKKIEIETYYIEVAQEISDVVTFDRIFDQKWLNKGSSMDSIQKSINETVENIRNGIRIIRDMQIEYEQEMLSVFLTTLDMSKALEKKNQLEEQADRIKKMKRQEEERKAEEQRRQEEKRSQFVAPVEEDIPSVQIKAEVPTQKIVEEEDPAVPVDVRLFMNKRQKAEFRQFVIEHGIKYTRVPSNR